MYDHVNIYITWITLMAYFRNVGQDSVITYISESLLETITLDKGYCKGNLYASLWFIVLLILYVYHAIQIYYTMVKVVNIVPEVKKMQAIPPKMSKK